VSGHGERAAGGDEVNAMGLGGTRPSVSGSGRGSFDHSDGGRSRGCIEGGESGRHATRAPKAVGSLAMPYSTQKPGRKTTSGKRSIVFR
jgi:hypothetical protein